MRTLLMTVALVSVLTMSGCYKATVKVKNLNPGVDSPTQTEGELSGDIAVWLLTEAEAEILFNNPTVGTAINDLPFKVVAAHKTEKFPHVCKGLYTFVAANAEAAGLPEDTQLVPGVNFNFELLKVRKHGTICIKVFNPEPFGPPEIIVEGEGEGEGEPNP